MFNDSVGLTKAVIVRIKTNTRRVATYEELSAPSVRWLTEGKDAGKLAIYDGEEIVAISHFALNEVVAVTQSYEDSVKEYEDKSMYASAARLNQLYSRCPAWTNKMFVRADEMPHHIKITNIRVEKLQDIDAKDCLREGVIQYGNTYRFTFYGAGKTYPTSVAAFQALIKKFDRKMWAANPYVWVYDFELLD